MSNLLGVLSEMTQALFSRRTDGSAKGSMIMRTKTLIVMIVCATAGGFGLVLAEPGAALALPAPSPPAANACGSPNYASNPQTVTCGGGFNPYSNGIVYNETTYPVGNQGNIQVNIAATALVTAPGAAVTATGVSGKNANVTLLNGSSVSGGTVGANVTTSGGGTASIMNGGTATGGTYGLSAQSSGGGLGSVINNGTVNVTGANAQFGIFAADGATISNTGSTTINGSGGANDVSGLATTTSTALDAASITNTSTGSVSVTSTTHNAIGFGSGLTNAGSAIYTNNGALTVTAGTGAAYGFEVVGGTSVAITDAQTAAGTTTTAITGSGALTGAAVSGATGPVTIGFSGQALTLATTGGSATGVAVQRRLSGYGQYRARHLRRHDLRRQRIDRRVDRRDGCQHSRRNGERGRQPYRRYA